MKMSFNKGSRKIRYAVVGLGDIAQGAVLPAFANARVNSELVMLVSDDASKLKKLSRFYPQVETCDYASYDACLNSNIMDAVYLALPNSRHHDFAVRAARAGVHVLCEKPLAVTEAECQDIIKTCSDHSVKLMTAYRLHFERANLEAIRLIAAGKIGVPRIFQSLFCMQVKPGNIRLDRQLGGGPLYDIGIYCINAARYLFRSEPAEVFASSASNDDARFREVPEMTSATMRFPNDRLASFTCSFGAADVAIYTVSGTRGMIRLTQAYEYSEAIEMEVTIGAKTQRRKYALRDQFGPELIYFSECILRNRHPEPSGIEGLLDVHIIRSLLESARINRPVKIKQLAADRRPDLRQEIHRRPVKRPPKVRATSPSK